MMIVCRSLGVWSWTPLLTLLGCLSLAPQARAQGLDSLASTTPDQVSSTADITTISATPDTLAPSVTFAPIRSQLVRPDRLQHASLAFAIGLGAGLLSDEPAAAAGSAAALGLAKELLDRGHSGFDAGDLWADLAGAALAALATYALTR